MLQTKWLAMLLNEGVDPVTNSTIIPKQAYEAITAATAIVTDIEQTADMSIIGSGLGWNRFSYKGFEVSS